MISHGKATLRELETVYSLQDAHEMLEIVMIDAHNQRAVSRHYEEKARGNDH